MSKELLVFIKNPVAGKVKTRLAAEIGEAGALRIYLHLLAHTLEICRKSGVPVSLYFSESPDREIALKYPGFCFFVQEGQDLGARMKNAFKEAFDRGSREVIIIGSDLYDLTAEVLEEAFSTLKEKDVVIGPARDGGYYLLGLKNLPEGIFDKKPWGTHTILKRTLDNLKGYNVALLKELNDIDILDDLKEHPELLTFSKSEHYGKTT